MCPSQRTAALGVVVAAEEEQCSFARLLVVVFACLGFEFVDVAVRHCGVLDREVVVPEVRKVLEDVSLFRCHADDVNGRLYVAERTIDARCGRPQKYG